MLPVSFFSRHVVTIGLGVSAASGLAWQADPAASSRFRNLPGQEGPPALAAAFGGQSLAVRIPRSIRVNPDCPPPTIGKGNQCVIQGDVRLTETLELASDTTLNCQGHKLEPNSAGSGTTRSLPEVAILVVAGEGVRVQNCVLDGFDFGIFVTGSKVPAGIRDNPGALARRRNRLLANVITARFFGIQMFSADNTEIKDNTITFKSPGGIGIEVTRDSDLNHIKNNLVIGSFFPPVDAAPIAPSNPLVLAGGGLALFVAQLGSLTLIPTLANVIVGDTLYQIPVSVGERTDGNLVEGNTVVQYLDASVSPIQGIGTSQAIGTVIRGNTVVRGSNGITLNGAVGVPAQFPGMCALDSTRLCLTGADCKIAGIDWSSKGSCVIPPIRRVDWPGEGYRVEGNQVLETTTSGINVAIASQAVVSSNWVGSAAGRGIALGGGPALETAAITRNVIAGVGDALFFQRGLGGTIASFFGARISLNDFTGYANAVLTSNDYDLPSELSSDGRGNHWGRTCADGGFDPTRVKRQNGTLNPSVVDSHPYGEPIARTPDRTLPKSCP